MLPKLGLYNEKKPRYPYLPITKYLYRKGFFYKHCNIITILNLNTLFFDQTVPLYFLAYLFPKPIICSLTIKSAQCHYLSFYTKKDFL